MLGSQSSENLGLIYETDSQAINNYLCVVSDSLHVGVPLESRVNALDQELKVLCLSALPGEGTDSTSRFFQ